MARIKEFDESKVLNKAVQLFWHKGYHGTSAQDLVDELGISRSSLYNTYGDKMKLFKKAFEQYKCERDEGFVQLIKKSENIKETFEQLFTLFIRQSLEDDLKKGCFIVNTTIELAPHEKDIAELVNQNRVDMEEMFTLAIKKGQDQGVFTNNHSARTLARFIINTIWGLRVTAKAGASRKVFDDVVKLTLSVLNG